MGYVAQGLAGKKHDQVEIHDNAPRSPCYRKSVKRVDKRDFFFSPSPSMM